MRPPLLPVCFGVNAGDTGVPRGDIFIGIEITVAGCVDSRGFIMDFSELDSIVMPLIARCDHRILNDVPGLENPTAELIALWFHTNLSNPIRQAMASLPEFTVRVWENDHCWADCS